MGQMNCTTMDIPDDFVARAKRDLADVWEGRSIEPVILLAPENPALPDYSVAERMEDPEKDLEYQLASAHWDLACLRAGFCNIPSIWPYMGVGVIPSAYGCEIRITPGEDPWTIPITDDPDDVYRLKKPDLARSGLAAKVLDRIGYFSEMTGGTVPIRLTDVQSPMDTATQILNYEELLIAMYTAPDAVHFLLEMVTDSLIEFVRMQEARAVNFFGHTHVNLWRPRGIYVSDDVTAVVSPQHYREFMKAPNERLSRAFGGISIHCCRGYEQNLMEVANLEGFMSFDADSHYNSIDSIGSALTAVDGCPNWGGAGEEKPLREDERRSRGIWHAWAENADEAIYRVRAARRWGFGIILMLKCGGVAEGVEAAREIHRATEGGVWLTDED